ncbi:MAG: LysM peptidoglycan-binding domain-containing protein, partial [Actinobacteria bacterium]|nr:LysM peptidoglycan-binding domain-containing protein [Actinomycetota bacterium]
TQRTETKGGAMNGDAGSGLLAVTYLVTVLGSALTLRAVLGAIGPARRRVRRNERGTGVLPRFLRQLVSFVGVTVALAPPSFASTKHTSSTTSRSAEAPWSEPSGFPPPSPLGRTRSPLSEGVSGATTHGTRNERIEEEGGAQDPEVNGTPTRVHSRLAPERSSHPALHGTVPQGEVVQLFPRHESSSASRAESMRRHPAGKGLVRTGERGDGEEQGRVSSLKRSQTSSHRSTRSPDPVPNGGRHRVEPGESLWSIAADHLHTDDLRRIARYWPRIHRLNRDVIGADPSLIFPGQVLRLPNEAAR